MAKTSGHIRIGIDVGGTFTHAVAVDATSVRVLGKAKVPTTHAADEGVARGIVDSLLQLLARADIAPGDIAMIAHSTTQATNALLEGDVAVVGIVGMGCGVGAALARVQTNIRSIALSATRKLRTLHHFVATDRIDSDRARAAVESLAERGAEVIVAAEAFSVDDPHNETCICRAAEACGLPATATHQVSQLHGLGMRTRTAVINASMIPKMLATANLTEQAVRDAGITAPVMIMRSDGGIMSIDEMRRRPILTMLSGPAAGVAAALLYARVSDGIFLEVGGTSTDISVIKNGRTQIRNASIGGNRLFLHTLDVRTIGVAGGSMVYLEGDRIQQVGPRSAHIAGAGYLSFANVAEDALAPTTIAREDETYLAVQGGEAALAITPTCASNRLGLVPDGDPARGHDPVIRAGLDVAAGTVGLAGGDELAEAILARAAERAAETVEALIEDYKLDRGVLRLVAGGGGGSAIVPFLAQRMGLPFQATENADVISAIGVALALVRDAVERTIVEPTPDDIRKIREEALRRVLHMGAAADTIEVFVEVDAKRNLLRATAEGALEIREQELTRAVLTEDERRELVAASITDATAPAAIAVRTDAYEVWNAPREVPRLWRFWRQQRTALRVLDSAGTIRWATNHGAVRASTVARARQELEAFAETHTVYSDAGATIPRCFVALGERIVDLSGLAEIIQVTGVLQMELAREQPDAACALLLDLARG
jgi:N-methylhydantoinase A